MTELTGSTALVTGATGGLGREIARRLHAEGASLVLTGRRREVLDEVAAEVAGKGVVADLSQREELERLLEEAGPVDIAVVNAALPGTGRLEEWAPRQIDALLEVNLGGPIALTRALLPGFLARGAGHFVYIGSLSAKVASPGNALYAASKFGLRGLAHALHCDLQGSGVGCSVINPGFVREAGMFVDSGAKLPPGLGTVTPRQVADAVVRALRTNRAEIDVAPLSLRAGALIGALAPNISGAVQARAGAGVSRQMIEGQRNKRP